MNDIMLYDGDKIDKLVKAANMLEKSNLIPYSLRGKKQDIFAILVLGSELSIPPMQALNSIDVIQGKTTISPQLMIGLVRSKLPDALIKITPDESKTEVSCTTGRCQDDPNTYTATWNMDKAKAMGLAGKDNYKKQPMNMLKWRAVAESFRVTFPDILMGLYFPQEFQDADGNEVRDVTPVATQEELDKDFPVPPEELEPGPLYRVQNGKFRGKQLQDIDLEEMDEYIEKLEQRHEKSSEKPWERELFTILVNYRNDLERIAVPTEEWPEI